MNWISGWSCHVIGHLIGDARPTKMTFWVGLEARTRASHDDHGQNRIQVHPAEARIKVWRSSEPGRVTSFGASRELVRNGRGNALTRGWKATVDNLKPDTRYRYHLLVRGNKGRRLGVTRDYERRGTFKTPASEAKPFVALVSSCMKAVESGPGLTGAAEAGDDPAVVSNQPTHDTVQPSWDRVPLSVELNLLLGDTHYANTYKRGVKWEYTQGQFAVASYRNVVERMPTYAIYDDHCFLDNNTGGRSELGLMRPNPKKGTLRERASTYFHGLWILPGTAPSDISKGIHHWFRYQGVTFIMLDTMYWLRTPYRPEEEDDILGATQWRWLEGVLQRSVGGMRVICSGRTLNCNRKEPEDLDSGCNRSRWSWESRDPAREDPAHEAPEPAWKRLKEALGAYPAKTIFLSGDVHQVNYRGPERSKVGVPELISSGIGRRENGGFALLHLDPAAETARVQLFKSKNSEPVWHDINWSVSS